MTTPPRTSGRPTPGLHSGSAPETTAETDGARVVTPETNIEARPVSASMEPIPNPRPAFGKGIAERPVARIEVAARSVLTDPPPPIPAKERVLAGGERLNPMRQASESIVLEVPALGRVLRDGVLYEIGAPVPVTEKAFHELRDGGNVEGVWIST